ncbi:hypothetical protein [Streptomyces sp. NPDC005780]|uniref:hypothetical protein n=1 Tax=Streptomyces sp. NPDC005780 TaxID=3364730 RepID=UPI0036CF439B
MAWKRRRYGLPDAGSGDAFPQPPAEDGYDSNSDAFADVGQRSCACGEFRCFWRNILSGADDHLLYSRFAGVCQGCAAQHAYAFRLPLP